jgi:predicted Zn-dependent protease
MSHIRIAWHPEEHKEGHAPRYQRQLKRSVNAWNTRRYPDLVSYTDDPDKADAWWRVQEPSQMGKHLATVEDTWGANDEVKTSGEMMRPTLGKVISDEFETTEIWLASNAVAEMAGGLRIQLHEIGHLLGLPHPKHAQEAWEIYGLRGTAPRLVGGIMEANPMKTTMITTNDRHYAQAVVQAGHRPGSPAWRKAMSL